MEDTAIFDRFRCKVCDGRGKMQIFVAEGDSFLRTCEPCKGDGYTIPEDQRRLWNALMHVVENKAMRMRANLIREAEKQFTKHFPPENPLCQAHPNVRKALTTHHDSPLSSVTTVERTRTRSIFHTLTWPVVACASIVITGWRNLVALVRGLPRSTDISVAVLKTHPQSCEDSEVKSLR